MQEILVELLFYDKYYHGTEDKIKQMETSAKPHHTIIGGFKKQIIRKNEHDILRYWQILWMK